MDNIFENAKFGDKFRTRDGRMAVYSSRSAYVDLGHFVIVHRDGMLRYPDNGQLFYDCENPRDIVGKWKDEGDLAMYTEKLKTILNRLMIDTHDKEMIVRMFEADTPAPQRVRKYYVGWSQKKSHGDRPNPKHMFCFSAISPEEYEEHLAAEISGCEDWNCKEVSVEKFKEFFGC